jgi:hypothetical protein
VYTASTYYFYFSVAFRVFVIDDGLSANVDGVLGTPRNNDEWTYLDPAYQITTKHTSLSFYMRISPRYSRAPSPRPLWATGDAHRRELLDFILLMMAPGCSTSLFPAL